MKTANAAVGSIAFFVAAPGVVAGVVPWWITGWELHDAGALTPVLRGLGSAMAVAGVGVVADCFIRFVRDGRGTPAPVAPTDELVVTGLYRRVRNPMYVGVELVILGQAAIFGDPALLAYAATAGAVMWSFVHWHEEPVLHGRYGHAYDQYRAAVPGWLPRPGRL